jgi:hypothetical protein
MVFPIVAPPDPRGPWFVKTWIYITSESFHVNMSSSGSVVCEKKIFKWPHPHFCIFVIISPLKRTWPLICTILNSLYLRMICTKFYWNWPTGSGEEDFFQYKHIEIFSKIFSKFLLFRYYLPLGKGLVLHLYNSESLLPKDDLCQPWLKLAQRFWRRSWKCKSLTDRCQTSDRRRTKGDQKSSLELSAQVS